MNRKVTAWIVNIHMFFSLSFSTIMHALTFHNDYAHVSFASKKVQISGPYFFFGTNTVILSGITLISEF